jgi:hypothetical protein
MLRHPGMVTWCFRNRIELRPTSRLQCSDPEWIIEDSGAGQQVKLIAKFPRTIPILVDRPKVLPPEHVGPIAEADVVILRGSGYASEAEAQIAGQQWRARLMRAFAAINVGADFGDRTLTGFIFDYGLEALAPGKRAMSDPGKLVTYECEPEEPLFLLPNPVPAWLISPHERLQAAMANATAIGGLTEENQVAYDLFSSSFGQSAEARYALLMMALECIINPSPRSYECRKHVESLISATEKSGLPKREIDSICGSLSWLLNQSIGQAGRALAKQLRPERYMDKDPVTFFQECYEVRSRLLHGNHPLPTPEELGQRGAELERFVANLLARS